jgi:hypothetical protein
MKSVKENQRNENSVSENNGNNNGAQWRMAKIMASQRLALA